jgi:hypothetical protein
MSDLYSINQKFFNIHFFHNHSKNLCKIISIIHYYYKIYNLIQYN